MRKAMGQVESMMFLPSGDPIIPLEHQLCEKKGEHQRDSLTRQNPKNGLQRQYSMRLWEKIYFSLLHQLFLTQYQLCVFFFPFGCYDYS